MNIITISREFGSGGRELGKRLADYLNIPCYDREIIDLVAEKLHMDRDYVSHISEKELRMFYPTTIGNRFLAPNCVPQENVKITLAQHDIILQLTEQGDCVIVGRCADVVCKEQNPLNLFVYADQSSKLARCKQRMAENETLSDRELLRKMKQIDKERAAYRGMFTETGWGQKESYHLCVNTSGREIKTLVPALGAYAKLWFQHT